MKDYKYIYLVGIGGIGMSALARWFQQQGKHVSGYDKTATPLTDSLQAEGMSIHFDDCIASVPAIVRDNSAETLVIYTPAIPAQNNVLTYFRDNRYQLHKRAEVLAMLSQHHRTIAVAGTHGKTTTTALLAHLLVCANKHMVGFLGGIAQGYASNLIMNQNPEEPPLMVLEADEFDRSFLHLRPHFAIVTTTDPDHLDIYKTTEEFEDAFKAFIALVAPSGSTVVHQDVAEKLQLEVKDPRTVYYAASNAPVCATNITVRNGNFYFDYTSKSVTIHQLTMALPGHYNIENALAAITVCLKLGIAPADIRRGLATFQGIERRFNYIIRSEEVTFIDDFAHHPVEIDALLTAVRTLYPSKKVTAIFRPHLYSRTQDFAEAFAKSLDQADQVLLLEIYPAREQPIEGVTSHNIAAHMRLAEKVVCTQDSMLDVLAQQDELEVVVLIGAGGVAHLIPTIRAFLLAHHQ